MFDVRLWGAVQAAKSAVFGPEGGSITFTSGKFFSIFSLPHSTLFFSPLSLFITLESGITDSFV
jgi:hypothetical protein